MTHHKYGIVYTCTNRIYSTKKYFYVSLGNNFLLFFCDGPLVVEALGNCKFAVCKVQQSVVFMVMWSVWPRSSIEGSILILQLFQHTGQSLSDVGQNRNAVSVGNVGKIGSRTIVVVNCWPTWLKQCHTLCRHLTVLIPVQHSFINCPQWWLTR